MSKIERVGYYYLRQRDLENGGNHPYACVCLIKDENGTMARGISVCAYPDSFSKQIGRKKSYGYAVKALNSGKSTFIRSKYAEQVLFDLSQYGVCSYYDNDVLVPLGIEYPQSSLSTSVPFSIFENSVLNG